MGCANAIASIKENKNFLITTHTSPEGDALGSELAFCLMLRRLGKGAVIVNDDAFPCGFDFLPHKEMIKRFKDGLRVKFDCFVTLDCSDLKRAGRVYRLNPGPGTILNIDHHISNDRFGDVNWVDPEASSCSEMVYRIYKKLRLPIDRPAALLLYTGILTDTGSFRYANTTPRTHAAVADLLRSGLDPRRIYKDIYESVPWLDMKLLIKVLSGLKMHAAGKIAWFALPRNLLKGRSAPANIGECLLSLARTIKEVEVAVLFKENLGAKDEIRVNLRSQGRVDVNNIASFFGGGGHPTASGCTVKGSLKQVSSRVLARIRQSL